MLDKIKIQNFKCFEDIEVVFGNITLLCGTNSSGKSSVIQALLLLENMNKNPKSQLNNEWLDLGKFEEVRNFITRADEFSIKLTSKDNRFSEFKFSESDTSGFPIESLGHLFRNFFYISANRIGPKDLYPKLTNSDNFLGKDGEFTLDLFYQNQRKIVDSDRIKDDTSLTLDYQVNYWLSKILNTKINVEDLKTANFVSVSYSFNQNKQVRPYHIGAGLSYVIGLIIIGLYIDKESVLIIENPEIHLHPKAQSDLADFLCFIAKGGVQVIIESHSDHIFNGLRKSVHNKTISKEDVFIHFFKMNENNLSSNYKINLSEKGKLLDFENGLFDQFDNDLDELLDL